MSLPPLPLLRRGALIASVLLLAACKDDPTTGSLVVQVAGLPTSALAAVVVLGPAGYSKPVSGTTTLDELPPGAYTIRVDTVHYTNALYAGGASQQITLSAGKTASANVTYVLTSGAIDLAATGLPSGTGPTATITGSGGFSRKIYRAGVIGELKPGTYTITGDAAFTPDGDKYTPTTSAVSVTVTTSTTPVPAAIAYALSSGTLNVVVNGLPASPASQPVTVTGPGGFLRTTSQTVTYKGMAPGSYTVTAANYSGSCPDTYKASQTSQTASVAVGGSATITVAYTGAPEPAANLNLKIDNLHVVQVVQDYAGTVPLVASRSAMLRVFGTANQCNSVAPKIRVTLSNGTVATLDANETTVRLSADQGVFASSWNYLIPAAAVQPGLTVFAEIDPTNAVPETNESDNRYPASGVVTLDVKVVPTVNVRFVPIIQLNGNVGDVNAGNLQSMLNTARKLHPVSSFSADLGASFAADTNLQADGRGWGFALTRFAAARAAAGDPRYQHGIVKVTYNSGVAGIGFIGSSKAALSWDYSSAPDIVVHEMGHNYGLRHAPGCGAGGPDTEYPYANGFIGQWGLDMTDSSSKSPTTFTDVMGYCGNVWISDYNFKKMLTWLTTPGNAGPMVAGATEQPGVLVWGRIVNGKPQLEPAFEVSARPQMPDGRGPHHLTATDASGNEVFSYAFSAHEIADLPEHTESFAFVVPRSALRGRDIAVLRVTARTGAVSETRATGDVAGNPNLTMTREANGLVRLRWDAARFPVLMVRDPETGQVLSFSQGGNALVRTSRAQLDVNYSNRIRSARALLQVR